MKILITADFSEEGIKELEGDGHTVEHKGWGKTHVILSEDEMIKELNGVDALFVGYEPVTQRVLDNSSLKVICSIRGGPRANVDVDHATSKGIPVIYTLGREAVPVADFTMGQIISLVRQIVRTDRELHNGKFTAPSGEYGSEKDVIWDMSEEGPWESRKGIELEGKNLGLIGFGTVGQQVAKRATAFGLKVLAYDPYQNNSMFIKYKTTKVDLDELVKNSDIISIHARSTDENKGLLGKEEFQKMKDGTYLINNARAALVDEKAMREALENNKLAGAALDVFHDEPIKVDDPLFKKPNVVLTPHIAGAGIEVVYRQSRMLVDDFRKILNGEKPKAMCNPEVLEGFDIEKAGSKSVVNSTNIDMEKLVADVAAEVIAKINKNTSQKPDNSNTRILTLEEVKVLIMENKNIDFNNYTLTPLAKEYIEER